MVSCFRVAVGVALLICCLGLQAQGGAVDATRAGPVTGQPPVGGEFRLRRATLDGGGGQVSGGQFVLRGTLGQHDVGRVEGVDHVLRSGFWTTPGPLEDRLFRDRFEAIEPQLGQFTP